MTLFKRDESAPINWWGGSSNSGPDILPNLFANPVQEREPWVSLADHQKSFNQLTELYQTSQALGVERRAINAGLRAVLREALKLLRAEMPNHPMLRKEIRQKIFDAYEKQEFDDVVKSRKSLNQIVSLYPQRPAEHVMEDI